MTPAAVSAGDGVHLVFDTCLSGCDCEIERRPYHRNCKCALHNPRSRNCLRRAESNSSSTGKVAFPIRRSWSEGCLAAYGKGSSSSLKSSPTSGSSSMLDVKMGRRKASMDTLVELCIEEADEAM